MNHWPSLSHVPPRLTAAIEASGKTRARIAKEAGTSPETVGRIANGQQRNPGIDLLARIAEAAGTTASYLLGGGADELTPYDHQELRRFRDWIDSKQPKIDSRNMASATIVLDARPEKKHGRQLIAEGMPQVEIPRAFQQQGALLVVRMDDDSMSGAGIVPGDWLFVVPMRRIRPADGKIVALHLGSNLHVRRAVYDDLRLSLLSENRRYAPITIDEETDEPAMVGVVIGRAGTIGG
jgi:transcriptional regulator with XRE-family HTH domain